MGHEAEAPCTPARRPGTAVALTPWQALLAGALAAIILGLLPVVWRRAEALRVTAEYRVPYSLGEDYWLYERAARQVCARADAVLLGDSVIWGHYVKSDETLSACLARRGDCGRVGNLGIDGIHPAALAGLVRSYGGALAGQKVILHLNFLWMSSPRHDLSATKESAFNHPRLVPQFSPRIPCYAEPLAGRLGIVAERQLSVLAWVRHVRMTSFDMKDVHAWSLEHPYRNPLDALTVALPGPDDPIEPPPDARPWAEKRLSPFNPPWVELDRSLQWSCFKDTCRILRARGNDLLVVIGPFNEHMLTAESRATYRTLVDGAAAWFAQEAIPAAAPAPLPSELYADASHPLAAGYALLAEALLATDQIRGFIGGGHEERR